MSYYADYLDSNIFIAARDVDLVHKAVINMQTRLTGAPVALTPEVNASQSIFLG